jgi:hypothetical protein
MDEVIPQWLHAIEIDVMVLDLGSVEKVERGYLDALCHTPVLRIESKHLYVCPGSSNHTYSDSS